MRRSRALAAGLAIIFVGFVSLIAFADQQLLGAISLGPEQTQPVDSSQCDLSATVTDPNHAQVACGVAYTPTPAPDMIGGVLVCTDHDPTIWHPIVKRDAGGAILCTYGHEHGDDPHALDGLFGAPNAWYGGTQSISYPWHTPHENEMKHWFYKYLIRQDLQPLPAIQLGQYAMLYMRNVRSVGHLEGFSAQINGMQAGFPVLNHSYSYEVEVCKTVDGAPSCGTVQVGGWQFYGHGDLTTNVGDICILACTLPLGVNSSTRHVHGGQLSSRKDFTWYGTGNGEAKPPGAIRFDIDLGTIGEATGWVDPNDYAMLHQYVPARVGGKADGEITNTFNGSHESLEVTAVAVPGELDSQDGATDGYVTFTGYATRWGVIVSNSTCQDELGNPDPGQDCVPVRFVHAPVGVVFYRDSAHNAVYGTKFGSEEHDVIVDDPAALGGKSSLIRFPN